MKKKQTAQELFAQIKERLFQDIDIEKLILACNNEDETRKLMVQQLERMLGKEGNAPLGELAMQMSDYFYTPDEGRQPVSEYQPCLDPAERLSMTEDEKELCSFYLTLAGLCHDLVNHYLFSLDLIKPGMETGEDWIYDFQITNKRLVVYLETTPNRYVASHICHIILKENLNLIIGTNDTLQAFLSSESFTYRDFIRGKKSPDEYIDKVLEMLNVWLKHDIEAERLNMSDDELAVYDQLLGTIVPDAFDEVTVKAARALATYFNKPPRIGMRMKDYVDTFIKIVQDFATKLDGVELTDQHFACLSNYAEYVYNSNFGAADDADDDDIFDEY